MKGTFWTIAARLVVQGCQFVVLIFAARLLGTTDVGYYTLIVAFANMVLTVGKLGWFEQLQQPEINDPDFGDVFWTAISIGVLLSVAGLAVAGGLVLVSTLVAATMAIYMAWITLGTCSIVQFGVIMRRTGPARIGQAQIVGEIVATAVALAGLFSGLSILAIGIGRICGEVTSIVLCALMSRWLPKPHRQRLAFRRYLPFGWQILTARLIAFAQQNLSLFIVGALMGPVGASLFRVGARFPGALAEMIQEPARLISWSRIGAVAGRAGERNTEAIGRETAEILVGAAFIGIPLFVGLAAIARPMISLMLGPEWADAAPVIAILSMSLALQVSGIIIEPALILTGHVNKPPRILLISSTCGLLGLLAGAPFGLLAMAGGQLFGAAVYFALNVFAARTYSKVKWSEIGRAGWPSLIGGAAVATAALAVEYGLPRTEHSIAGLAATILAGAAAYIAVTIVFAPTYVRAFVRIILQSLAKRSIRA